MRTRTDLIADGIYRFSTFLDSANLVFNQFLIDAAEPLLFHCGPRSLFSNVLDAVARIRPVSELRWISFGHVEADECGAMNHWLAAAPRARVAFGALGCAVSVNDLADRLPRPLENDELLDLGGKRVRYVATPHVPHGWDAGLLFEEATRTLLCGDLFTQQGHGSPISMNDPVGPALQAEDLFRFTAIHSNTAQTIHRLAMLAPLTLAPMHGPAFKGDCATALHALADGYAARLMSAGKP
ncbi:MAG: MBL fold metallo-hydrolase [Burkholderiales bacterium]